MTLKVENFIFRLFFNFEKFHRPQIGLKNYEIIHGTSLEYSLMGKKYNPPEEKTPTRRTCPPHRRNLGADRGRLQKPVDDSLELLLVGAFFGFMGWNFVPNTLLTAAAHLTSPYLKMMNLDSSAEKVELFLNLNFLVRGGAILVHHCFSEIMNCFNTKGHIWYTKPNLLVWGPWKTLELLIFFIF